jgi:ketol-acid reductoisomerase
VFEQLYESVTSGEETRRTLECNSAPDYREKLDAELKVIHDSEMWRAGAAVRALRPENRRKKKVLAGNHLAPAAAVPG